LSAFYDASLWVPIGLGVTVVCAIAVTARPLRPGGPGALALVVTGAGLTRQGAGELYSARASKELIADPAAAAADANRSLEINSDDVQTYYVKAAALARLGSAHGTEAVLRQALAREPRNFVTWSLLGDIAVRRHKLALARRDYVAAHRLNPRNATLLGLARDPALALR